jgi:hypothetical protein
MSAPAQYIYKERTGRGKKWRRVCGYATEGEAISHMNQDYKFDKERQRSMERAVFFRRKKVVPKKEG